MTVTWVDRLSAALGLVPKPQASIASSDSRIMDIFAPASSGGLPVVSEHTAWTVSAITACVNLISGAMASMPMNIHRRGADGVLLQVQGDPLWWMLNEQFTPRWSAYAGWTYLMTSRLMWGDGFLRIVRGPGGSVAGLDPIHPTRVRVIPTPDGQRLVYEVAPDPVIAFMGAAQTTVVLDQDDMIHITGEGFNGLRSVSPLRHMLAQSGAVAMATQDYAGRFFANNARPDFAIVGPAGTQWSKEKLEQLKAEIDERHRGAGGWHRPMFLSGGATIEMLGMPIEDMQLLGTRQFQIEEIARAYGVPPFMIGHNEKTTSWGSGVEQMGIGFVRYTLGRHLTAIHNEFNRKLIRQGARVLEFDTFELERADMKTMFDAFRVAVGRAGEPGFLTVDEVRGYLKRGPAPQGINTGAQDAEPAVQPAGV